MEPGVGDLRTNPYCSHRQSIFDGLSVRKRMDMSLLSPCSVASTLPSSLRSFRQRNPFLLPFSTIAQGRQLQPAPSQPRVGGRWEPPASPPAISSWRRRPSIVKAASISASFIEQRGWLFPRVGAESTGPVPAGELLGIVEAAAKTGADVVMGAVDKPRNITHKGATDLVTETDKMSESAILEVVRKYFPNHLILGEEGGIIGDSSSDYLWCIDPLDGTTNFAHGYPSFAVSVGVLFRGKPAAASVVEFVGGPMCWNTRVFTASTRGGAFCNGQRINVSKTDEVEQSLPVTGFGYEHDGPWATNIELFKHYTDVSRGVRRLGVAAVDMSHVALGIVESYWEYRLKPWDMAAGVLMVEEAGGVVTRMDGGAFSVFDRSVLVSNGVIHGKLLERIGPATEELKKKGIDFSHWFKPENYNAMGV